VKAARAAPHVAQHAIATVLALAAPAVTHAATLHVTITGAEGQAIPQVVVHAAPTNGRLPATPPRAAQMDQVDKEFVPFVQPVQQGAAVTFPNKDNIRHHVYSFSPARTFELKLYSGTSAKPVVFDKPGPVTLGCNIHDWMVGHVFVVEGPWFAKTGKDGKATLELPPGEFLVKAWHPWMKAEPAPIKVQSDSTAGPPITFRLVLVPPSGTGSDKSPGRNP
jgi:plastocyanin